MTVDHSRTGIRESAGGKVYFALLSCFLCSLAFAAEGDSNAGADLFKFRVLNNESVTALQNQRDYGDLPFTAAYSGKEQLVISSYVVTSGTLPDPIRKDIDTHIKTFGVSLSKQTDTKIRQFISEIDLDAEQSALHRLFGKELAYASQGIEADFGESSLVTFFYLNRSPMKTSVYPFAADDYERARFGSEYLKALTHGSFFSLGVEYGRLDDPDRAVKYFEWAANTTVSPNAQHNAGLMHARSERYKEAASWYEKASAQKHADASTNLGYLYQNGLGVETDRSKAIFYYEKAVTEGSALAAYNLGAIASEDERFSDAFRWLKTAKEMGYQIDEAVIVSAELKALRETREFLDDFCNKFPGECN